MRNLMPITRPMGAADLTQAAEDAGKLALALSDLAHGVAAYEAATGAAIAVVDADKAVMVGLDLASGPDETVFGSPPETRRGADLAPHSIIPRRVQARPAGPRRQAPIADHPRVAWAA